MRLLYNHGYQGTTVDAVLADAGVPKGSFYHHFGSKESFGQALLDRYVDYQQVLLQQWISRDDLPVPDRLSGYHQDLVEQFVASNWSHPCLAGKLSNELALSSPNYRTRLGETFTAWAQLLATVLADGQQRQEVRTDLSANQLANAILAMVQGGFVAAMSLHDRGYLDAVSTSIADLVRAGR